MSRQCSARPLEAGSACRRAAALLVALALLACVWPAAGCGLVHPVPTPTAVAPSLADAEQVAAEFAAAWQNAQWDVLYQLLTVATRSAISQSALRGEYRKVYEAGGIRGVRAEVAETVADFDAAGLANAARVRLRVVFQTDLAGDVETTSLLHLQHDGERWRVAWTPEAILELLGAGMTLQMIYQTPPRGQIYGRDHAPLAVQGKLITVGVVPQWIQDEARVLQVLSETLHLKPEEIRQRYANAARPDWFMPIADITPEQSAQFQTLYASLAGVVRQEKPIRIYPMEEMAFPITGYVGQVTAEELAKWRSAGYTSEDIIGKAGVEGWAESYLSGKRGGRLVVVDAAGQTVAVLGEEPPKVSQSVHLALDARLQATAYEVLSETLEAGQAGAIVALDPRNGDLLAMVSSPAADPNALSRGLTAQEWQALLERADVPLLNRGAQGLYPLASVFKVISTLAALEHTASLPGWFYCGGSWSAPQSTIVRNCWLRAGHGQIDLLEGLTQSCDVVYYEVAQALYEVDPALLPDYARRFGLGQRTGVQGLDEAAGLVPDAAWKATHPELAGGGLWTAEDAINLAIGQGYLLVTPLQAANLMAAVANGGILYRPRLVREIVSVHNEDTVAYPPEEIGRLGASAEHLAQIRRALQRVAMSPQGTAYAYLGSSHIPLAGKTGTAETGRDEPHAWFVGYAPADDPQIVVAVIVEHGGEGSEIAAPLFRRVVESYLSSTPQP